MVVPATAIVTPGRRPRMSRVTNTAPSRSSYSAKAEYPVRRSFSIHHIRSGILGRPLSRAMTAGYASAIPRWTQGRGGMPDARCTRGPCAEKMHTAVTAGPPESPAGTAADIPVICADCEAVYFCGQDWTASIRLIQLCKFGPARTPRASLSMPATISSVVASRRQSPPIRIKFGACSSNDRNRFHHRVARCHSSTMA